MEASRSEWHGSHAAMCAKNCGCRHGKLQVTGQHEAVLCAFAGGDISAFLPIVWKAMYCGSIAATVGGCLSAK